MQRTLKADWGLRIGKDRLVVEAPSFDAASEFADNECDAIAIGLQKWGLRECLIFYPHCLRPFRVPVAIAQSNLIYKEDTKMLRGLVNQNWLRVAEEIYSNSNPTFLVDNVLT